MEELYADLPADSSLRKDVNNYPGYVTLTNLRNRREPDPDDPGGTRPVFSQEQKAVLSPDRACALFEPGVIVNNQGANRCPLRTNAKRRRDPVRVSSRSVVD